MTVGQSVDPTKQEKVVQRRLRRPSTITKLWGLFLNKHKTLGTWCFGLLVFERDIGFDKLKRLILDKMVNAMPRFRSKYDFKTEKFILLKTEELDMNYHFKLDPVKKSKEQIIEEYMCDVYGKLEPDVEKPLWQLAYFPNLAGGGSLLLTNIFHGIADGVSQVEILNVLMDRPEHSDNNEEERQVQNDDDIKLVEIDENSPEDEAPDSNANKTITAEKHTSFVIVDKVKKVVKVSHGFGPLNKVLIFINGTFKALAAALAVPDATGPLKKSISELPSLKRSFAFTETISLEKVKELKTKYNATVNDILVSLLTLTIRSYLLTKPEGKPFISGKKKFRASFPINRRGKNESPFDESNSPHNKVGMGIFKFPLNITSRTQLVYTVKRELDQIKLSSYSEVQSRLIEILFKALTKKQKTWLFEKTVAQTSGMLSNVFGPTHETKLLGVPITELQFGVYVCMSLYLGLISYNNKVNCCVCLDEELGKAEELSKHWKIEFDRLCEETAKEEVDGVVPKKKTFWMKFDKF